MKKSLIHPSSVIGPRVSIGSGARIGPRCRIEGETTIGAYADIGEDVVLSGDALIGDGCIIEPRVSTIGTTLEPGRALRLGRGVRVGSGSVLSEGISIGVGARIEPGTLISGNVPAHAIVEGNPAKIVSFGVPARNARHCFEGGADVGQTAFAQIGVEGVEILRFPLVRERRGLLTVGEFGRPTAFQPKRHFLVWDVPGNELRGGHAHLTCEELLICIRGGLAVVVDDGATREEIELDEPNFGLFLPARVWATQYRHVQGTVLLVFASHHFDPSDYIRNYEEFLAQAKA